MPQKSKLWRERRVASIIARERSPEQDVPHQKWLTREIERGVAAADAGELVDDKDVEAWFRSIRAAG